MNPEDFKVNQILLTIGCSDNIIFFDYIISLPKNIADKYIIFGWHYKKDLKTFSKISEHTLALDGFDGSKILKEGVESVEEFQIYCKQYIENMIIFK